MQPIFSSLTFSSFLSLRPGHKRGEGGGLKSGSCFRRGGGGECNQAFLLFPSGTAGGVYRHRPDGDQGDRDATYQRKTGFQQWKIKKNQGENVTYFGTTSKTIEVDKLLLVLSFFLPSIVYFLAPCQLGTEKSGGKLRLALKMQVPFFPLHHHSLNASPKSDFMGSSKYPQEGGGCFLCASAKPEGRSWRRWKWNNTRFPPKVLV